CGPGYAAIPYCGREGIEVAGHQAVFRRQIDSLLVNAAAQEETVIGRAPDRDTIVEDDLDQLGLPPCNARVAPFRDDDAPLAIHRVDGKAGVGAERGQLGKGALRSVDESDARVTCEASEIAVAV